MKLLLVLMLLRLILKLRRFQGVHSGDSLSHHSIIYNLDLWVDCDLSWLQVWHRCVLTARVELLLSHHVIETLIWLLLLPGLLPFTFPVVLIMTCPLALGAQRRSLGRVLLLLRRCCTWETV